MVAVVLRALLIALVAVGVTAEARAQSTTPGAGKIKKVDAKTSTVTIEMPVRVKKKKELADKEYLLAPDASVTVTVDGEKKEVTGKEALEGGLLKAGEAVTFKAQGDLKIVELHVGVGGKKK